MNFDEITQILEMMREHDLSEFELERDNFKLRLRKNPAGQWSGTPAVAPGHASASVAPAAAPGAPSGQAAAPVLAGVDEALDLAIVKSPIVGTFYRASEPGAQVFAEVGDTVKTGQVLCIIEAMKLMNEINAECDGQVVKVYVENGQAVQYGERLFALKPSA